MKLKNKKTYCGSIDARLAGYAAVAGAALAAPALPSADATIITNNINLPIPANFDGVYIDFFTGATDTAAFDGFDFNAYLSNNNVFQFFWPQPSESAGGVDAGGDVYASLSIGAVVSAASPFTQVSGSAGPGSTINFQTTGQHILGFQFLNENTGQTNFGYAIINNQAPNGFPATLVSYSYENNGGAITVVPEPTTFSLLGVLATGAIGVRIWRKRKVA